MNNLVYKPNQLLGGFTLFDEIFDDIFNNDRYIPLKTTNIVENDDNIQVTLDVPGFKKSEISVHYENDHLTIQAIKDSKTESRSNVSKTVHIPGINIKKSNANNLEDGV